MPTTKFTLNGRAVEVPYEPGMHLLEVLREECGILSAKDGCAPEGTCGCCLVLVDGTPALSCLRKPEQMSGHEVRTLEGLPDETRRVLGEAFVLEGGVRYRLYSGIVRAASVIERDQTHDRQAVASARRASMPLHRYRRISTRSNRRRCMPGQRARLPPRRHLFLQEFGLRRNPAFAAVNGGGNGVGKSVSARRPEQALGDKPFVDDMRAPCCMARWCSPSTRAPGS
jgi:aerobic-type carbon monoxide dehydrogenase small subunit (CoxS/CutS family)